MGLDRDSALLARALAENGVVAVSPRLRNFGDLLSGKFRADAAFHIERVAPWWKRKVSRHFLIPNQERFPERLLQAAGHGGAGALQIAACRGDFFTASCGCAFYRIYIGG